MLLKSLFDGKIQSSFILIKDSLENSGLSLLLCLTKSYLRSFDKVHFFCTDWITTEPLSRFHNERLVVYNICGDPLNCSIDLMDYLPRSNSDRSSEKSALVVDSIDLLLLNSGIGNIARTIRNLSRKSAPNSAGVPLMFLTHTDVITACDLLSLEHMAMTIINLMPARSFGTTAVEVTHKCSGGKVIRERYQLAIDIQMFEMTIAPDVNSAGSRSVEPETDISKLTSKLTFSVTLRQEEEQKRSALVLPYEKIATAGGGKIIYDPEECDDVDEEDPDDDLDV